MVLFNSPGATLTTPRVPVSRRGPHISHSSAMPARQIMLRTVYAIWRAPGIYRRLIRVPVGLERTHYRHFWEKRDQRLSLYWAGLLD